jgi:glycosyltransferase involved in cell wall biosynthesis
VTDPNREPDPISAEHPDLEVSVIIPARNEERSLSGCLASLLIQSEPGFALGQQWEIIVVNDDSTDKTWEIAAKAAAEQEGVFLLDAPSLDLSNRGGFTGKSNACWTGAQVARGRHLLFTDADTIHETNDIARSLREADRHKAVLLSYSPRQIVTGFWQHAVMPLVFSELAAVYPSKQVNDPVSSLAAANGQFILVERDAYFSVGGHRAIGKDILEDVALAHNIKRSDRLIRFRYAPDALSTRMYATTSEMIEGWTKNLALLFPKPVALALWRILDLLLFFGLPTLALGLYWLQPWQRTVIFLLWIRTLWRFYTRVARSNFPWLDVAISILGIPLFVYLLVRSVIQHRIKKNVAWKGRSYDTST